MKVLVTNVYSYENKGDAAIVIALVSEVRRVFPTAEILIQTIDVEHDKDKYGASVDSSLMWILMSSVRDKPILRRIFRLAGGLITLPLYLLVYKLTHIRLNWILSKDLKRFVDFTGQADFVVACGGGYLRTSITSPQMLVWLSVVCLNFLTGHYLGKPVYMYSQSIGPLHDWLARFIVKFSLNRTNLIEVREDISLDYVRQLGIRPPVIRTADPAFLLRGKGQPVPVTLEPATLQVGVTVRQWFSQDEKMTRYLEIVAKTIDYLIEDYQARVTYVPQVIATGFGDDDRLAAKKLWQLTDHKDRFRLLLNDMHPLELIGLCGQMDLFIGTRMHSNIFALLGDVPVVAIQYEHKTKGIMQGLGIGDAAVEIEDLSLEQLKKTVDHVIHNKEAYKDIIQKNIEGQRRLSSSAMEIIRTDLEQNEWHGKTILEHSL